MAFNQSISELLDDVREAIIEDQKQKGLRSSGKSADSLKIEVKDFSGQLVGAKYFYQQKFGRKPGKFPPIDDILNWIREKGIQPRDPKTNERQLAFLFARKIAEKGTDIFQGSKPGLNIDDKIVSLVSEFKKNITKEFKIELIKRIKG